MNLEYLKSILLVSLIASSLLLTLALWNHQPDFEVTRDEDDLIDAQIEDGERLSRRDVLQPTRIILHDDRSLDPIGFKDQEVEQAVYANILDYGLYNFSAFPVDEEWLDNQENRIEIIFPTEMQGDMIYDLFSLDQDTRIPEGRFNRIEIILDQDDASYQIIFRNDENQEVIGASLQNYSSEVDNLESFFDTEDFIAFTTYEGSRGTPIYLPDTIDRDVLLFSFAELDYEPFVNFLFSKPSIVRRGMTIEGHTSLIDGTRELMVESDRIFFTNPTNEEKHSTDELTEYELFDQVQTFINTHNGFTFEEPFHYFLSNITKNTETSLVEYSLSYKGVPIFYDEQVAKISVAWHNQEAYQYSHPLVTLAERRGVARESRRLPDTEAVVEILDSDYYRGSSVYDVTLGYRVNEQRNGQGQVYELVPTWYVKGVNGWQPLHIPAEMTGGDDSAVGTN
ncbi:YycH family regulatory protein [Amphibacillus jilinensis]|uniref:YycH family regulatory protein n=1 Tax=Amphibacillus jilinensis TaxID=1216008 RepID=UPI00030741BC|nr:two-component system activity regulator YycH [Amphibacillus jilinensis]